MSSTNLRKSKGRRSNGDGCVYWREDRQRWITEYVIDNFTKNRRRLTKSFRTEREATSYLAKLRSDIDQGLPATENRITLGQVIDYWLTEVVDPSRLADNTKSSYRENAELHVKPAIGQRKLVNLRYEHVQAFINAKRNAGYSKSSMKTMMVVVRKSIDQAVAMEPPVSTLTWTRFRK